MQQPPSREPPDPRADADAELAKTAGVGCLAGMGVVGITLLTMLGILVALMLIGGFLLFLTCGGH